MQQKEKQKLQNWQQRVAKALVRRRLQQQQEEREETVCLKQSAT